MKCLVVGYGSIGRRHARVLTEMGHQVALVTRADDATLPVFPAVVRALEHYVPDYVVIANDTRLHGATLRALAEGDYSGTTLVEKPVLARSGEDARLPCGPIFVGYTLRFHPIIDRLWIMLREQRLWTLTAYVGQYLPDWRPQSDYRQSYSARREDGGVVRDLSHELDYAQMLAGQWQRTVAAGGHLSALEIESEDAVSLLAECERCPLVTVHMNYLDRSVARWIVANGEFGTVRADLVEGVLAINGKVEKIAPVRDAMIRDQHVAAMLGDDARLCSYATAMDTLRWIEAAQVSLRDGRWMDAPPRLDQTVFRRTTE